MKKSRKNKESKFDFIEEYAKAVEEADKDNEIPEEKSEEEPGVETAAETEETKDSDEEPATDPGETTETETQSESEPAPEPEPEPEPESKPASKTSGSRSSKKPIEDEDEESPEVKWQERHRRRVRNEVIAYSVVLSVLVVLGIGIGILIHFLVGMISDKKAAQAAEEAALAQAAAEQETVVVEAPESVTEQLEEYIDDTYIEDEPETEVDYLEEMVTSTISQMPVEDKVAQLFVVTPEALTGVNAATKAGDGTREALMKYAVGGLIYDRRNVESEDQLIELIDNTKNMSKYDILLGVREAGGDNSVLSGSALEDIPAVDAPADIASSGLISNAYNAGVTMASYLSYFGFNLNLAPNGSLTADEASVSASVSYGSDEASACEMITQMISGLSTGSVSSCMTDFPGTGNITQSTADGRVESEISAEQMTAQLVPYITGTAAGARFIQTNNVNYITVDPSDMPASLSGYIIGSILRGEMAFDGVIVTAPLNEKAVTDNYSSADAALAAVEAGADIIYMPENLEEAYNAVLEAVTSGTIPESRIDESLDRIFRVKFAGYVE